MKSDVMSVNTPTGKKDQKEILNEGKDLVGSEEKPGNADRVFGSLDLWNLQKRSRSSASMIRRLQ